MGTAPPEHCIMSETPITLGYWKIRGLAAAPRMMCYYGKLPFNNKCYGDDFKETWFGGDKPKLAEKNSLINLPYVIDGDEVITQSNSVLHYIGAKAGIDLPANSSRNHQALDQIMDLRNDLMKIVYGQTAESYPGAFAKHMDGPQQTHMGKLEGFVKGPYFCGDKPQSADFHMFEMMDQHMDMVAQTDGVEHDFAAYPKLMALHAAMKAEEGLKTYFESTEYREYSFNNALFSVFKGAGYIAAGDTFGPTTETLVTF